MINFNCTMYDLYKLYYSIATIKKAVVSFMDGINGAYVNIVLEHKI